MNRRAIGLGLLVVAVVVSAGCKSRTRQDDASVQAAVPAAVEIRQQVQGSHPSLTEPGIWLINSQRQLQDRGVESADALEGLDINFRRQSLVLLALGERPTGGFWARIEGIQQDAQGLYVQAVVNRPGTDAMVTQALTHPYTAAVIAKVDDGLVRLEPRDVEGQNMNEPEAQPEPEPELDAALPAENESATEAGE